MGVTGSWPHLKINVKVIGLPDAEGLNGPLVTNYNYPEVIRISRIYIYHLKSDLVNNNAKQARIACTHYKCIRIQHK